MDARRGGDGGAKWPYENARQRFMRRKNARSFATTRFTRRNGQLLTSTPFSRPFIRHAIRVVVSCSAALQNMAEAEVAEGRWRVAQGRGGGLLRWQVLPDLRAWSRRLCRRRNRYSKYSERWRACWRSCVTAHECR